MISGVRSEKLFLAFILACGLLAATTTPVKAQRPQPPTREDGSRKGARPQQRRLAPPSGLACDDNHVTSFTGHVLSYSRRAGRILIRVRTDEDTTEEFTIGYTNEEELSKRFLLNGESLTQGGLAKIESHWRRDRKNVRATIWACYDNEWRQPSANRIDWHIGKRKPPETL